MLEHTTTAYGVTIAADAEYSEFLALGHPDRRRVLAAAARLLRHSAGERYFPGPAQRPRLRRAHAILTDDGLPSARLTTGGHPGARPVTRLTLAGRDGGEFEVLTLPSRCPDCSRTATTARHPNGPTGPFTHQCTACATTWPATPRP